MPQSKPKLIDNLQGAGSLLFDGQRIAISYAIGVFQEMLDVGAETPIPGLKSAAGHLIGLEHQDARKILGRTVELQLVDGKKADIILTNATGAFVVTGPIG